MDEAQSGRNNIFSFNPGNPVIILGYFVVTMTEDKAEPAHHHLMIHHHSISSSSSSSSAAVHNSVTSVERSLHFLRPAWLSGRLHHCNALHSPLSMIVSELNRLHCSTTLCTILHISCQSVIKSRWIVTAWQRNSDALYTWSTLDF